MTKAIILAAGEGKRLLPLTLTKPKCLVEADGRPLLSYQLQALRSCQVDPIVLVAGYLAAELAHLGLPTYVNPRYAETNMVYTLFVAERELHGDVIVSYGDIAYSKQVLRNVLESPHDIAVAIDLGWEAYWRERFADPLSDAETLKFDRQGRIAEIGQKPKTLADISGQYIGLMKFTERGLGVLRETYARACAAGCLAGKPVEKAYMTDLLQQVIASGHDVWPVRIDGGWVEIDSAGDLSLDVTRQRLGAIATG